MSARVLLKRGVVVTVCEGDRVSVANGDQCEIVQIGPDHFTTVRYLSDGYTARFLTAGLRPVLCKNCFRGYSAHADNGKCLYEATFWEE